MNYYLCLEKHYNIKGCDYADYEQMLDNLVYLLQSYGIDDEEILDTMLQDTCVEVEEEKEN